ncbi:hypothetical protein KJ707_03600 [Patescibacteria group bacterium]|nr:hypothetical protein [Patescibacteria group bacterium]MBU1966715.1 hypothetical protein [Patescibacteria group bacterium]MBU2543617.1 hypothetical protein [Patescibacteria group bacterium]
MSQVAGFGEKEGKGFPGEKSGRPTLAEVTAEALTSLVDLMSAPVTLQELSEAFARAKQINDKQIIAGIRQKISRFLDRTQKAEYSLRATMTSLESGDARLAEYQRMLDLFSKSLDGLVDLEEQVGTWLERN